MAKRVLLGILFNVLCMPFRIISSVLYYFDIFNMKENVFKCVSSIDSCNCENIPDFMVDVLIAAEDRRNSIHYGVDPIAMLRAFYVRVSKGETQGASTIEQQFVRVVTAQYDKTLIRKFKEQMLATAVSKQRDKRAIAKAYLANAFYGSGLVGVKGVQKKCAKLIEDIEVNDAVKMVSRLKYPEPSTVSLVWLSKYITRVSYIYDELRAGVVIGHCSDRKTDAAS